MALSNELISQFVKATQDKEKNKKESTAYGKIVKQGDIEYVQLDGSDLLTPISSTITVKDEDRVMVTIKNHSAIVTGNLTDPSASGNKVKEIGDTISEFEIVVADKVTTQDLEAINAYIEHIRAISGKYEELSAITAEIETLQAKYANMEHITAKDAEIINAEIESLKGEFAEFTQISTEDLEAINAEFDNIVAYNATFTYVSAEVLEAMKANINDLEVNKLDAKSAEITYANIDFSNIKEAAIEKLFTDSGIIKDLIMSDGKVTGELVGVTIKGDLIEGNTLKADKLVILGEDGLYYKLNVDALGETTASSDEKYQNGLDGSVIIAESITAEKVAVDDLVAFGATIGGYRINEHALYSGTKNSVSNTTRGVFLGDDGQVAIGDSNNYLKFFKDANGQYKLEIQASALKFGTGGTTVEDAINEVSNKAIISSVEQFYLSTSPTKLEGGSWSTDQPTWSEGKYIWRRTFITKGDGTTEYQPSANGVCITGNTGSSGNDGKGVKAITKYYLASVVGTVYDPPYVEWDGDISNSDMYGGVYYRVSDLTLSYEEIIGQTVYHYIDGNERSIILTEDRIQELAEGVYIIGEEVIVAKNSFAANDGSIYPSGIYFMYVSASTYISKLTLSMSTMIDGLEGWTTEIQTITPVKKYLWSYESIEYTDGTVTNTDTIIIGVYGKDGAPGPQGEKGETGKTGADGYTPIKGVDYFDGKDGKDGNGITSTTITYQASTSGTTIPTGSWSSTIPTVAAGSYLWTRTVTTYTSGDPTTAYSVGKMGSNGAAGAAGKGIKSAVSTYQTAVDGITIPTGDWMTSIPKTTADKPYLWTRTITTYTDDTTSTAYAIGATPEGITVGGRNLFSGYNEDEIRLNDYQNTGSFTQFVNCLTFDPCETVGETYTISFWACSPNGVTPLRIYNSNSTPRHFRFDKKLTNELGEEWEYFTLTITNTDSGDTYTDTHCNKIEIYAPNQMGVLVKKIKVEKGNKATDWTPAPEDVDSDISKAQTSADNAQTSAENAQNTANTAQTTVTLLQNMISHLVTDANGGSLMTQTPDGWTFNMSSITGNLEAIQKTMEDVESGQNDTNDALQKLTDLVDSVAKKTAYITLSTDDTGAPCIELGKTDNPFKVRITNTAIDFLEGSTKIAYANNNTFYSSKIITKEIQIGEGPGFVWRTRSNGNMGLTPVS